MILLAVSPAIIATFTHVVKKIPLIDNMSDPIRATFLRMVVAILSVGTAIAAYMQTGVFDASALQGALTAIAVFLATSIPYWLSKRKATVVDDFVRYEPLEPEV